MHKSLRASITFHKIEIVDSVWQCSFSWTSSSENDLDILSAAIHGLRSTTIELVPQNHVYFYDSYATNHIE